MFANTRKNSIEETKYETFYQTKTVSLSNVIGFQYFVSLIDRFVLYVSVFLGWVYAKHTSQVLIKIEFNNAGSFRCHFRLKGINKIISMLYHCVVCHRLQWTLFKNAIKIDNITN